MHGFRRGFHIAHVLRSASLRAQASIHARSPAHADAALSKHLPPQPSPFPPSAESGGRSLSRPRNFRKSRRRRKSQGRNHRRSKKSHRHRRLAQRSIPGQPCRIPASAAPGVDSARPGGATRFHQRDPLASACRASRGGRRCCWRHPVCALFASDGPQPPAGHFRRRRGWSWDWS